MSTNNNHINYIEFYASDLDSVKEFYHRTFGWTFTDYGDTYCAFTNSGLEGGFEKSNKPITNGALVVLYHHDLEHIKREIINKGGEISVDIFTFPGGKRFHFKDPVGNELAVWSEL
ncbi:VOC family protein [Psychroserpens sp. BH13MA-6]